MVCGPINGASISSFDGHLEYFSKGDILQISELSDRPTRKLVPWFVDGQKGRGLLLSMDTFTNIWRPVLTSLRPKRRINMTVDPLVVACKIDRLSWSRL